MKAKGNNILDNRNILTKNITADLSSQHTNPKNKYKFQSSTNSHLSKPTTSYNAFAK